MSKDNTPYYKISENNTKNDQVKSLPGIGLLKNTQFAGYAPMVPKNNVTKDSSALFYWFVGTEDYSNKPTVIWTNGGPGSSSFWGFFLENGPYHILNAEVSLKKPDIENRSWAWNNKVNYMIIEHPLTVMVSYGASEEKVPKTPEQGAEEYYNVLQNFLDKHPEIRKNPIILAGESYAGTYLPLIANNIHQANINGGSNIDLASIVLLDAWVSPITQMKKDTEYAYYHGLISKNQKRMYDLKYQGKQLNNLNYIMQEDLGMYFTNIAQFADPSFQPVFDYLNRKDVRKAINVDEKAPNLTQNWSQAVSKNYTPHLNNDYAGLLDNLLKYAGFKIQVISGLNDAKDCTFLGTGAWLEGLTSEAANIFHDMEPKPWKSSVNNKHTIGFVQDGGQLSWVKVLNAGHMAVRDQPEIIDIIISNAGV